jgi:hypothetical protein
MILGTLESTGETVTLLTASGAPVGGDVMDLLDARASASALASEIALAEWAEFIATGSTLKFGFADRTGR